MMTNTIDTQAWGHTSYVGKAGDLVAMLHAQQVDIAAACETGDHTRCAPHRTMSVPVHFVGTVQQHRDNRATHSWVYEDGMSVCIECDAKAHGVSADWPCAYPVPRTRIPAPRVKTRRVTPHEPGTVVEINVPLDRVTEGMTGFGYTVTNVATSVEPMDTEDDPTIHVTLSHEEGGTAYMHGHARNVLSLDATTI